MSAKHRLTERDISLFEVLRLCRALTTHQIQALFFPGPSGSRCRERLKFLSDEGFIGRLEQPSLMSAGRLPFVYIPKLAAIRVLAARQQCDVASIEWNGKPLTADYLFLAHILDIAEVYIQLCRGAQMHGFTVEEWLNDLTLKRRNMVDRFEVEDLEGGIYTASLVPDASFVITTKERSFRFLLEVDKGTETLKTIGEKFLKYRNYFQPKQGPSVYEHRYGTSRGRVLIIAPSSTRLQALKRVCEEVGGRTRFLFGLLSELQTQDVYTAPLWQVAGSDERSCLL